MKKHYLILVVILLFFLLTRFYKVSEVPSSLYWDEASIGYNAYSLIETGKDEWGVNFPLHFKAFGEYKLPLYIYSTSLPIKIFGLTNLAVRFSAIIFSFFSILLTYLIAKKISNNNFIALTSAFFLSITPYFFIFSRTGYEATAGLTCFLLGTYIFLLSLDKIFLFPISALAFAASMYAYNGYRILSPVTFLILSLILLYGARQKMGKAFLMISAAFILFLVSISPMISFLFSEAQVSRYHAVGIQNLDRKKIFIGLDIAKSYLSHFNPEFLFLNGDKNIRSSNPGFGQLFIFDALLISLGLIYLRKKSFIEKLPIFLALLGFIPASVTREFPHALRSLATIPFICIISSYGAVLLKEKFTENKNIITKLIIVGYLGLFLVYFNNFINVYSKSSPQDWQEGYRLIFQNYTKIFNQYDYILVSDRYSQPYIFALTYLQYNPEIYRSSVVYNTDPKSATSVVKSFDKFIFTGIDYNQLPIGKILIFSHPDDKLIELPMKDIIYHSDGTVAFYIYEINNSNL